VLREGDSCLRYIYVFLFYLALPFIFLRLLWRSRRAPDYRKRWAERLGYCPYQFEKSIWVHAVSVGETIAAIPLIKILLQEFPQFPLVITNMTPTGAARVKAVLKETVKQVYIPYDIPNAVDRFLKRINPQIAIIMETELWPNLFARCRHYSIPIVILNARLSNQSARGYACIPSLKRDIFTAIHSLAAQSSMDAERFIQLGLSREKVKVTGNLKFDLELPADLSDKSKVLRHFLGSERLIWIAASTHQGEEEIILAAHHLILKKYPSALLILVPRHPDRFISVAELAKQKTFNVVRRSSGEACSSQTQIYLGDTMGELLLLYDVADVAFVAGSFAAAGGHNMLEPAVLHKPIITGPILFNFAEISQMLLQVKGMVIVKNAEELAAQVECFFTDKNYCHSTGENAYQVVAANRGALQKQLELIRGINL
jgi:3-deoxy-D-manno-octulosonic-acid transferase